MVISFNKCIYFCIYFIYFRSLCDINQHGKLDMEQFSLAMWLVERKLKGIDPPTTLTTDMIPPRSRTISSSTAVQVRTFLFIKLLFHI